ncbi:hypothetical protein Tco_1245378 [Tanacetum coccineum]
MNQEKVQQEKLKAVKARLNFEEVSQHSESGTLSRGRDLRKRLRSKRIRSVSKSPKPRRGHPNHQGREVRKEKRHQPYHNSHRDTESCYQSSRSRRMKPASKKHHSRRASSRRTEALSESEENAG